MYPRRQAIPVRAAALLAWAAGTLALCHAAAAEGPPTLEVASFSKARPGGPLPEGWEPWILTKRKKLTEYTLVADEGGTVVRAEAHASASGLIRHLRIDPREYPIMRWRWKAANLIPSADNRKRAKEDSPVRVYVGFEGDVSTLSFTDRMFFKVVKAASGQELPYASLSYLWENDEPRGSIFPNPSTDRIQMVVAESGPGKLNQWVSYERNVLEDYRRAFHQEPGMITGVSLMTDCDNTGESAVGYYGDIVFIKAAAQR